MTNKKRKQQGGAEQKTPPSPPSQATRMNLLPEPANRYQLLLALIVMIVGICVLYPELVFQNKVFHAGDVEAAASFATPITNAIEKGERYPLWNPYLFSGMPSYGSMSYNPYVYPVSVLTTFLVRVLHFPNPTWLLFHIVLLGMGVFLLLRDRGVHFIIAVCAGIIMMWMPNHVAVGAHGHGSQACAVGYIPFALLFWDRLWRSKGVLLNASALIIILGFQLLRAHIQISYYTFVILGLHFLFFGFFRVKDAMRGVSQRPILAFLRWGGEGGGRRAAIDVAGVGAILAIVVVGALLVSAVLMWPVQDYAKHSIRGASETGGVAYDYATSWSLHPKEMATFLVPFSFGFGRYFYYGHLPFTDYPNYLGVIVAALSILALFLVRTRFVRFLLFLVLVSTFVAFGKHLPILYDPLFKWMPHFNKFRVPVMVLIVQQLAIVLLSGIGLSALLRSNAARARRYALWATVGSAAVLLIVLVSNGYWKNDFPSAIAGGIKRVQSAKEQMGFARLAGGFLFHDLVKLSLLLLAGSATALLYFKRVISTTALVAIVLLLALSDLYLVDRYILHPQKLFRQDVAIIKDKSVRDQFMKPDAVVRFLQQDKRMYRVMPMYHPSAPMARYFTTNRYMNFSISSIGGYHPAKLSAYDDFLQVLRASLQQGSYHLLDMLNVRYLISANPFPDESKFSLRWQGRDYRGEQRYIYENPRALPRVFFAEQYRVVPGKKVVNLLASAQNVDFSKMVVLEKQPGIEPVSNANAEATITKYGFNEIRIDARLDAPAIMVLSEIFYPSWRAYVDGEPDEIIKADGILRAVALTGGSHEVVFRYEASVLKKALGVSIVAFAFAFVALVVSSVQRWRGGQVGSADRDSDLQRT